MSTVIWFEVEPVTHIAETDSPTPPWLRDVMVKRRSVMLFALLMWRVGVWPGVFNRLSTTFASDDHRAFNREGAAFDKGETFSGIDYETGLKAVEALRVLTPEGMSMAQMSLRWILAFPAVTCAIPGARRPTQVDENVAAADLPPLTDDTMAAIDAVYAAHIQSLVHHAW